MKLETNPMEGDAMEPRQDHRHANDHYVQSAEL